jgi:hypothetical protein
MNKALYTIVALLVIGFAGIVMHSIDAHAQGMASTNYSIERDSLNAGGLDTSTSSSYTVRDTVGEQATGRATSSNYQVRAGYRQMAESNIAITAVSDFALSSIGGVSGGASTAVKDWNITTDNPAGYEMKVRADTDPAMQNTTADGSFADYDAGTDPDYTFSVAASESAFGFSPEGANLTQEYQDNGSSCNTGSLDTQSACWRGFTTSGQVVASAGDNNQPAGATTSLRFRAESGADNIQPAGDYQATITVTAVAI